MSRGSRMSAIIVAVGLVAAVFAAVPGASGKPGKSRGISPAKARAIALDYAERSAETSGSLEPGDVDELTITDQYRSTHTGITHVYLRQVHQGLEVRGGDMTVNVMPDGDILYAGSRFVPNLDQASGRAALEPAVAAARAGGQLGLRATRPFSVLDGPSGTDQQTLLSRGGISLNAIPARLVWQPMEGGAIRLAWNLEIAELGQLHWWNVSVDAQTGSMVSKIDYVDHDTAEATGAAVGRSHGRGDARATAVLFADGDSADGSSYRVYALPLESPNEGDRTVVTNPADAIASPFGWHDTNSAAGPEFTTTQGNNVQAYTDTVNDNGPDPNGSPDGGSTLTFDNPIDFRLPPPAYKDAAVTNLFYWSNTIHDVFYSYGFDEAAGNFQTNNYGRGGLEADSVMAEAQDGSGADNANFATPVDGQRPRMQMYVWTPTSTPPGNPVDQWIRDGDFDAGIITHEYGHGISNRLTGGPSNVDCLRAHDEREGEGWSDWLALALTALPSDSGEQARGMGTYAMSQEDRHSKGIRPTPYSTDMTIDPATYDTIKDPNIKEPHGVGYVWATMLWEMYWGLIGQHGFNPDVRGAWNTGGNNLAVQLVMDGMKIQPCSPGFVDARDAILAADIALTQGANQCIIWAAFAKRGLGFSADQKNPASKTDGVEGYDTHPDCEA